MVNRCVLLGSFLLIAVAFAAFTTAQLTTFDSPQTYLTTCYQAILSASKAGVDTTPLIAQLNQALNLTAQAQQIANTDPSLSQELATQTQTIAENMTQQAIAAEQSAANNLPIIPVITIIITLVVGGAAYVYGPRLLWRLWFRFRRNYRVTLQSSKTNNKVLVITAQQVCAAFLGITILVAAVVVYQNFIPARAGEQFSELGVLGPNMKLGDYPAEVVASDTVHLYGYVGNQMGSPMFYMVQVKLGDNNTKVNPANLTAIQQYQQVLPNNASWTFPIDLTLTETGANQRLIFELWVYNTTTNQNQYHERWGQIWLNVTAPAS